MEFKGIYAPIPTPFIDEEIAWDKLDENLKKWEESDLTGLTVLGSNGEFVFLDPEEKVQLVKFVRAHFPRKIIAGTGCESTRATIEMTKKAADAGADCALVITPSYYRGGMTDEALKVHYTAVADASPIPVMLYNMPRNTGVNMSVPLVVELARHPNIVGIKDSSGNIVQIADMVAKTRGEDFVVFAGSGSFLLPTLLMGGVGGTLAVANVAPNEAVRIQTLFEEGRLEEARKEQARILDLNAAVTSRWGVPGLKAALDLIGYFGGKPRHPLVPLSEDKRAQLAVILREYGFEPRWV